MDPGNIFKAGSESSDEIAAVRIISEGSNAENLDNYDERLVKRMLISRIGEREALALGSSRAALITSDMVGTESFFNLSVAGAMLQEAVATYGLYYEQYGAPDKVVISVDPWFFCENHDNQRFHASLADGFYSYATERMGMTLQADEYLIEDFYRSPSNRSVFELGFETQKQLFSVTYFQQAAKELLSGESKPVVATEADLGEAGILRADGSYSYPAAYCNISVDVIAARAGGTGLLGDGEYDFENGAQLPVFRSFLGSLAEDGVEVQLLLVPINPITYGMSIEAGIPLDEIESVVRTCAAELGIPVVGAYDAADLGKGLENFYDAYHFRPECVAELMDMFGEVQP